MCHGGRIMLLSNTEASVRRTEYHDGTRSILSDASFSVAVSDQLKLQHVCCRLWSAKIGQDFVSQCNLLGIDYCSIHLWPDNWNTVDTKFPTSWITAHETATKTLNKPLVLEEVRSSFLVPEAHATLTLLKWHLTPVPYPRAEDTLSGRIWSKS